MEPKLKEYVNFKGMTDEEIEGFGSSLLMQQSDRGNIVSEKEIIEILKKVTKPSLSHSAKQNFH